MTPKNTPIQAIEEMQREYRELFLAARRARRFGLGFSDAKKARMQGLESTLHVRGCLEDTILDAKAEGASRDFALVNACIGILLGVSEVIFLGERVMGAMLLLGAGILLSFPQIFRALFRTIHTFLPR